MPVPTASIVRSEARLFLREPGSLFWIIVFPAALVGVLGAIPGFQEASDDLGGARVVDAYVGIAVLISAVMATVQAMPPVIAAYREQRILRRLQTTPASPRAVLGAQLLLHGAAVAVGAALCVAVGRLTFDSPAPERPAVFVAVVVATFASCAGIGALVAGRARTTKAATTLGTVAFFPLLFAAGTWLPVSTMPDLVRRIVELLPTGASAGALGEMDAGQLPTTLQVAVMVGWAIVPALVAVRSFRWE